METSFSWVKGNPEPAVECYSDEPVWRKRLLKLAEENPDEVTIKARPEENDGAIIIKIPSYYMTKIGPKKQVNMTDEQKSILADRMRKLNKKKQAVPVLQTRQETAVYMGIDILALDELINRRDNPMPHTKQGKRVLIPRDALEEWIERERAGRD